MKIRDRIKEVRKVRAGDLLPNPRNWRTHPQNQRDAMKGVLAEIGMADVLLAYETPGGLMLIDGHARAEVSPETEWTVCVLDVDDREAATILATLDPLGAMAGADAAQLDALLRDVNSGSAAVQQMLAQLLEDAGGIAWSGYDDDGEGARDTNNMAILGSGSNINLAFGEVNVVLGRDIYDKFLEAVKADNTKYKSDTVRGILERGIDAQDSDN